jgi:ABC-2 type transport system permease protein
MSGAERGAVLLGGYVRYFVLHWLAERSFVCTLVVSRVAPPLIGLAVWCTALPGRSDVATYYAALLLARMLTISYENHTFSGRVYSGELADDLLRPHPVVLRPLGENLAIRLWHGAMVVPLLLLVGLVAPLALAPADVALAVPALLLAAALRFLFTYTLALAAFWTQRAHAVVETGNLLVFLLGGEAAPLPLLPDALRPWAAAMPFRAMSGFPAEVAAGLASGRDVLLGFGSQLAWLVALALAAIWVWRAGVRRYTAVGG